MALISGGGADKVGKGEQKNSKLIFNDFGGNIRTTPSCLLVVTVSVIAGFYRILS